MTAGKLDYVCAWYRKAADYGCKEPRFYWDAMSGLLTKPDIL
jgi:hypothetical protein